MRAGTPTHRSTSRDRISWRVAVGSLTYRVLASRGPITPGRSAVVLVHGIGMSHRYLSRLHDVLAAHAQVFSIDLPGYAGLPKPREDVDVVMMAHGLGAVVASLDAGPVTLVGHSMGSQWVVESAVQRPELVRHVVALGPVTDARHRTVMAQMRALAVDSLGEPPLINAIVFSDYVRCGPRWYLAQVRHMLRYPIEARAAELSMPLLVIRGGRDPIAGVEWCRRLRDSARQAELVVIPRHHHVAQHSAPIAVAGAIDAYTSAAVCP
jgi:pimeloyl-ACP methyl ester carboxylesterase